MLCVNALYSDSCSYLAAKLDHCITGQTTVRLQTASADEQASSDRSSWTSTKPSKDSATHRSTT